MLRNKLTIFILLFLISTSVSAQFVAIMEVKESIPGICDDKKVYALFPSMNGQKEAICPVTKEQILKRLNNEVNYVKENPKYDDKGMIGIIINCKGEVVSCKMDNKTRNLELDRQIEAVFNSLGEWKPGQLNKKEVDTSRLFSFKIKNGKFEFN